MVSRTPARRVAAVAVLALASACQDAPSITGPTVRNDRSPRAQDRLEAVFQRVSPEVMALPGTVFADNDEAIGKVVIGVENVGVVRGVQQAMARLGVAEGDYAVELTQPIRFAATLRDRFATGTGGMQVHFSQYVCSVGFNVDHAGGRSFIINSHCTTKQGGTEGTLYYQPTSYAYPVAIATEAADPGYFKGQQCPRGKRCRVSDAARAAYAGAYPSARGSIGRTTGVNNGSITIDAATPTFAVTAQDDVNTSFPIGLQANKVGRTTGWTRGIVTRTCVNTSVQGSTVYLLCQSFVSDPGGASVVGGGDSGSGVWTTNGSGVTLLGILWGGSSDNKLFVFSPLRSVQQELGSFNAVQ